MSDKEIPVDSQIQPYQQLVVGLPADNQTILGLARELAARIKREPISLPAGRAEWAAAERAKLKQVVRYKPVTMKHAWAIANTYNSGLASISYRFELNNGLSATGVWFKETDTPQGAPVDIVLDDKGKKGAASETWNRMEEVAYLLDRGDQVILLNLLFTGDDAPLLTEPTYVPSLFASAVAAVGDRPLGLESAQLVAVAHWAQETFDPRPIHVELTGIRTQMAALIAGAIQPGLFSSVTVHQGMESLDFLLQRPVAFGDAPDLFCLNLYKDFDINELIAMAEPTKVLLERSVESPSSK